MYRLAIYQYVKLLYCIAICGDMELCIKLHSKEILLVQLSQKRFTNLPTYIYGKSRVFTEKHFLLNFSSTRIHIDYIKIGIRLISFY